MPYPERLKFSYGLGLARGSNTEGKVDPPLPEVRFYYPLDGLDDGVVLGEPHVIDGTPIEIYFLGVTIPTNSYGRILKCDENYDMSVDTNLKGDSLRLIGCTATLNGLPVVSGTTKLPTSGNNKLLVTPLPSVYGKTVQRFGYALVPSGENSRYLQITFSRIKIGSAVNLTMDDGPTADSVLVNTGTGGDAFGRNFNNNRWYESEVI